MKYQNNRSKKFNFPPQRICYLAAASEEEANLLDWLNVADEDIEAEAGLDWISGEEEDRSRVETAVSTSEQLAKGQNSSVPQATRRLEELTKDTRGQVLTLAEYRIIRGGTDQDPTFVLKKAATEKNPLEQEYELSDTTLGKGSFGLVYEARDLVNNEPVAIKVLDIDTEDDTKRFLEEIEKMEAIDDSHIVQIKNAGRIPVKAMDDRSRIFLVMPKYEGSLEDLQQELISSSEPEKIKFLKEKVAPLVAGLEKLHGQGLIHRDIKPENILIDSQENLILSDLGVLSNIEAAQKTKKIVGSCLFFSPEMLVALTPNTVASDRFALGVTLYESFTGKHPYLPKTNNLTTLYREAVDYSIPSIFMGRKQKMKDLLIKNQVPREFILILLVLLDPDPKKRMKIKNITAAIEAIPDIQEGETRRKKAA